MKRLSLFVIFAGVAFGQCKPGYDPLLGQVTCSTPLPSGAALPSTCTPGQAFALTSASPTAVYTCGPTANTWALSPAGGGSMTWPAAAGIAVYGGSSAWGTSLTAPSGAIVGTTDTQTLTNKTVDGVTPTTLGYLDATSSVQTQLNGKAAAGSYVAGASALTTQYNIPIVSGTPGTLMQGGLFNPSGGVLAPMAADSTNAIQLCRHNGTTCDVTYDSTNGNVGIGTTAPGEMLQMGTYSDTASRYLKMETGSGYSDGLKLRAYSDNYGFDVYNSDVNLGLNFDRVQSGATSTVMFMSRINGNVGIGTTSPVSKLHIGVAPVATPNYATLSIGSGAWDGVLSGYFQGAADGTHLGINAAAGSTADFVNWQIAGVKKFGVDYTGAVSAASFNGAAIATAATASTIAERNASGELIALNTVATGKTPMATDTALAVGQIASALITPAKMAASTIDSQTDASTVTWAIGSVLNAQAKLTFTSHAGTRTLNITNPVIGGNYLLKLIQDGTGGEGLTLGTGCTWKVAGGGAGAVTLTNAANALDVLSFTFDGTNCLASLLPNLN